MASYSRRNVSEIAYRPTEETTAWPEQVLNVFLRADLDPLVDGPFPTLVHFKGILNTAASPPVSIFDNLDPLLFHAITAGWLVVSCGSTGFDATRLGKGLFRGRDKIHSDWLRPHGVRDAVSIVQHLQESSFTSAWDPDLTRVCLYGRSSAAGNMCVPAFGPDLAQASGSSQIQQSTRLADCVLMLRPQGWRPAMLSTESQNRFPTQADSNTAAATVQAAPLALLRDFAALFYGFDAAAVRALNAALPVCLFSDVRLGSSDFRLSEDDAEPRLSKALGDIHDGWFAEMWWRRLLELDSTFHNANSLLVSKVSSAAGMSSTRTWAVGETDDREAAAIALGFLANRWNWDTAPMQSVRSNALVLPIGLSVARPAAIKATGIVFGMIAQSSLRRPHRLHLSARRNLLLDLSVWSREQDPDDMPRPIEPSPIQVNAEVDLEVLVLQDGAPLDLSNVTAVGFVLQQPNGLSLASQSGSLLTNGRDGLVTVRTTSSTFGTPGDWRLQVNCTDPIGGDFSTQVGTFPVAANLV